MLTFQTSIGFHRMGTGTLFFRRRIPILSIPRLRRQCHPVPPSRQSPDRAESNSGRLSRTRCRSGRPSLSGNGKMRDTSR